MARSDYDKEHGILGRVWEKSSNKGPYMSGFIYDDDTEKETRIMFFRNRKRDGKNDPDWQIVKAKDRENREQRSNRQEDERERYW